MAFVSEIVAKMGLDTTAFRAALTKTTADVGRAGDDIGRKLNRAFGAGDVFKGLLQGLGIQSVQSVVDKLTDGFKEAADNAKEIEKITQDTADIYEKIFSARRTNEQNLNALRQRDNRLLREEQEIRSAAAKEVTTATMTGSFGVITKTAPVGLNEEQERRLFAIAKERAEIQEQAEGLQKRVDDAESKRIDEIAKQTERYNEAVKKLAEDRASFDRQTMSNERAMRDLILEKASLEARLIDDVVLLLEDEVDVKRRLLEVDKEIQKIAEKITDEAIDKADAEVKTEKALRDQQKTLKKAQSDFKEEARDRSSFTVEEVARGGGGITQTQKAKAKEILRLERQARRQRAQGFEASSEKSTAKALDLRSQLGILTSNERDPLAQSADAIKKSESHLQEIKNSLLPGAIR